MVQRVSMRSSVVVAGLTLALSLTACGQGYDSAGPAALDDPKVQSAAQDSHEIYQQIWGNANEREASNFLSHWTLNGAVGQCMTDAGYPWHAPMAYNAIGYSADGGGGTVWLGAMDQGVSDWLLRSDRLNEPAQEAMNFIPGKNNVVLTQGYRDQLDKCDKLRGDPERKTTPSGTEELSGAFHAMVSSVDEALGSPEEYIDCMKRAGFDVSDAESFRSYLLDQAPPQEQRLADGFATSDAWLGFIAKESDALDADRTCRGSQYTEGMRTLGPKLTEFASEHADALAETDAAWAAILDQAKELGFEPVGA